MATVPFEYECNVTGAFVTDPNAAPVGWVTALDGLGLLTGGLQTDLTVTHPLTKENIQVVGVLESFRWLGGPGDPLQFGLHLSQSNATQLRVLTLATPGSTEVDKLGWWIGAFDQEAKVWFEQSFPLPGPYISAAITSRDEPALDINLNGTTVKDGIDVYQFSLAVIPGGTQQYDLHFANSPGAPIVKSWGLPLGTLPAVDIPPAK